MNVAVPREHAPGERRVAITPDAVRRLTPLGLEVLVESGAGVPASLTDDEWSRLAEELRRLGAAPFVARAGNGLIYHRQASKIPKADLPVKLMRRLKDAFDPKRILPELPA